MRHFRLHLGHIYRAGRYRISFLGVVGEPGKVLNITENNRRHRCCVQATKSSCKYPL